MPSTVTSGNVKETRFITYRCWKFPATPGATWRGLEVVVGEGVGAHEGLGVCSPGVGSGGLGCQGLTLYW